MEKKWSPFVFGCFAGVVPWAVIFAYIGGVADNEIPSFVWGILASYLFFFNTFPVNMVFQYKEYGPWNDEYHGGQKNSG